MAASEQDYAAYQKACAVFGRVCADNAATANRTIRLVARHRPEILDASLRELRAFDRAAVRALRAIEAELEKGAAWEDFLDGHKES